MNELKVFTNNEFGSVRTLVVNGEPYFVGKDIADILGYKNANDALKKRVDKEDKGVANCDTLGGTQSMVIINESGLYSLILSSKLPGAKRFKHWVTSDVLPTIRKHGLYAVDEILGDPDVLIKVLQTLKEERVAKKELETQVAAQNQRIAEMKSKVTYYDTVLACKDVIPITVIAKDYGWSAIRMNNFLHETGVQYKVNQTWVLYQKHAEKGYTETKTTTFTTSEGVQKTKVHTYWTQKGRLFIYEVMKKNGYLPVCEQN